MNFTISIDIVDVNGTNLMSDIHAEAALRYTLGRIMNIAPSNIALTHVKDISGARRLLLDSFWDMLSVENSSRRLSAAYAYHLIFEVAVIAQQYGYRTGDAAYSALSRSIIVTSKSAFLALLKTEASITETAIFDSSKIQSLDPSTTYTATIIHTQPPTGAPTQKPTITYYPTSSPTVLPPAMQPSTQFLYFDLHFVPHSTVYKGTIVHVSLPQVSEVPFKVPGVDIIVKYPGQQVYWNPLWNNVSRTLDLIATSDHPAIATTLHIGAANMTLQKKSIYENDTSISYQIEYQNITVIGNFSYVLPHGFASNSISFGTPLGHAITDIKLYFKSSSSFQYGDIIRVLLPGFSGRSAANTRLVGFSSNRVNASWSLDRSLLTLYLTSAVPFLNVTVSRRNRLFTPYYGCNEISGTPTVSLLTSSGNWYEASPFLHFRPFGVIANSKIYFTPPALAGQEVSISLDFEYYGYLMKYDVFDVYLPHFWSSSQNISISNNTLANATATWMSCANTLRIIMLNMSTLSHYSLNISGLRLPYDGVTLDIVPYINISTNASGGNVSPQNFESIELVGAFLRSEISFSTVLLNSSTDIFVTFQLSCAMLRGDEVQIHLPNLTIAKELLSVYPETSNFVGRWDAYHHILSLAAIHRQDAMVNVSVIINSTHHIRIPTVGFPAIPYGDKIRFSLLGSEGSIAMTPPLVTQYIGFMTAEIFYDIQDTSYPMNVRLHLKLSDLISEGDKIRVSTPLILGNSRPVIVRGSDVASSFICPFNVSFNSNERVLTLYALENIIPKDIYVFITSKNNFYFDVSANSNAYNLTHLVSATIATIGNLSHVPVTVSPYPLPTTKSSGILKVSNCSSSSPCNFDFKFVLYSQLKKGEMIALSHSNIYQSTSSIFSNAISVMGNAAQYFYGLFRPADSNEFVKITSNSITLGTQYQKVFAKADYSTLLPAILDIPETMRSTNAVIVAVIPRIQYLYVTDTSSNIICGDSLLLQVIFSEPVMIVNQVITRILFNTLEYANYLSGNGTDTLTFIYHITNPITVLDLEVYGPAALEYGSQSLIVRNGSVGVPANTTIPGPYGFLLRSGGLLQKLSINCNRTTYVTKVFSYVSDGTYASGDIIDIGVTFDREVVAVGTPVLILEGSGTGNTKFIASYVNVSRIQSISVYRDGYFSVVYGDSETSCLEWSDSKGLQAALSAMTSLNKSLPVNIVTYPLPGGYQYMLTFSGLAPTLLQLGTCTPAATAYVQISSQMYHTVIFRYVIRDGDISTSALTYPNASALILRTENDAIFISATTLLTRANTILPSPGSAYSLSSLSNLHIDTTVPTVLNVSSTFTKTVGAVAVLGDVVQIIVTFSRPVVVSGSPYLDLRLDNYTDNVLAARVRRTSPLHYSSGTVLVFQYEVVDGDIAQPLDIFDRHSLHLNGSRILQDTLQPTTVANVTLPHPGSVSSLASSNVIVNATTIPHSYLVNSTLPAGSYGAGEDVPIILYFRSPVTLVWSNTTLASKLPASISGAVSNSTQYDFGSSDINSIPQAFVNVNQTNGTIYYTSGSGTTKLVFTYTVRPGDSGHLSFGPPASSACLQLRNGYFKDSRGQTWSAITYCGNTSYFNDIIMDTSPPIVEIVNSSTPNGVYYPGDLIDVSVVFNKAVVLMNGIPEIALIVPYQSDNDLLAQYSYGNGTKEIHFSYVVPPPNYEVFLHVESQLDYAGTTALSQHSNGAIFLRASTHPITSAIVMLPTEDVSYLKTTRNIVLNFATTTFSSIKALNSSGTYTAGDTILIEVTFTNPVMIYLPPVLKLATGAVNRSATYVYGNKTRSLVFSYTVQKEDTAVHLDYIDTRYPPYDSHHFPTVSLPLNTDIRLLNTSRISSNMGRSRSDDIIIYATEYGGIFAYSEYALNQVDTSMPIPGTEGSLSTVSDIVIDTVAPNITKVYSTLPNGSYGVDTVIPIYVQFSVAVVVNGCPTILFHVSGRDRYAYYVQGSGTQTLYFEYVVSQDDQMTSFDYVDRYAFQIKTCGGNSEYVSFLDYTANSIMRLSQNPSIQANITMPWVGYIESVIAPTSITGSGNNISLAGPDATASVIMTNFEYRTYGLGDIIDIYVNFSSAILMLNGPYITFTGLERPAYYEAQDTDTSSTFRFAVQIDESVTSLTYASEFALHSASGCDIIDTIKSACAVQTLPRPNSNSTSSRDAITPLSLTISQNKAYVENLFFIYETNTSTSYETGSLIKVAVIFSEYVVAIGSPMLELYLSNKKMYLVYAEQYNATGLVFEMIVSSATIVGDLYCLKNSRINLNAGSIVRYSNYLPLSEADISLETVCCVQYSCNIFAPIVSTLPYVVRVYGDKNGTFSYPAVINIFVEFNHPISVSGYPYLILDLEGNPTAEFISVYDPTTLLFQYSVRKIDFTGALEYRDTISLYTSITVGGINKVGSNAIISADTRLPIPGAIGSLGRDSSIVLDNNQPRILSVTTSHSHVSAGDLLRFYFHFAEPMHVSFSQLVDASFTLAFEIHSNISSNSTDTTSLRISSRTANYEYVTEFSIVCLYTVSISDPYGKAYIPKVSSLSANDVNVTSVRTGIFATLDIPVGYYGNSVYYAVIDNTIPKIAQVYSTDPTSTYGYGVGDVINIYVQMTLEVVILKQPTLILQLNYDRIVNATFLSLSSSKLVLHFNYEIKDGDMADALETYHLYGDLRKKSYEGLEIRADLTLPAQYNIGSLGYCCKINIDSSPPYIQSLIPLKRAGLYGANEVIAIMARFSKPITVLGHPVLELQTGGNRTSPAYYDRNFTSYDLLVDIGETDIIFRYVVQLDDAIGSLHHSNEHAIKLQGGLILRTSAKPTTQADIILRSPNDFSLINGTISRQWMFRYPQKVEVLVKDLYHTEPNHLNFTVRHLSGTALLFSQCCLGKTFGRPYPNARLGNNVTKLSSDTGIGYDYFFSDTRAPNIAPLGVASQSDTDSTGYASNAIDRNTDPLFSEGSVTLTGATESNAWWQVHLPAGTTIYSINIWPRLPETWVPPVLSITIKGLNAYPSGKFKLTFTGVNRTNLNQEFTTGYIQMGTLADTLRTSLLAIPVLITVTVTRYDLDFCRSDTHGLCGPNIGNGYGYNYVIVFEGMTISSPNVVISNTSLTGIAELGGGSQELYGLVTTAVLVRSGYAVQTTKVGPVVAGVNGENYWLVPYWVMIFDSEHSPPPAGLSEGKNVSIWKQLFTSIETMQQIVLPTHLSASYVKIQRDGVGPLSLAEVEVYTVRIESLNWYNKGSPVEPPPVTHPYQPTSGFAQAFNNVPIDGSWVLEIEQDTKPSTDSLFGWSGAEGTISDWVLLVTDLAGVLRVYYQDLFAQITALPKYGALYMTVPGTASEYGDWRDFFEFEVSGQITARQDTLRKLGVCYGVDTTGMNGVNSPINDYRYCPNNYGVPPTIGSKVGGDLPSPNYIRGERIVVYQPRQNYLGPDFFTYVVYDGLQIQTHVDNAIQGTTNEVEVNVRFCRQVASASRSTILPLCACEQSEQAIVSNKIACLTARYDLCSSSTMKTSFQNMCMTCAYLDTLVPNKTSNSTWNQVHISGDCQSEIVRGVGFLVSRGMCSLNSTVDCSSETLTKDGTERVNFLTLRPYISPGSFTSLGNSYGGYGFFNSPVLA